MNVIGRKNTASEKLDFECFRLGSPNKYNGSDHLPIGCVFELRPDRKPEQVQTKGSPESAQDLEISCTLTPEQMKTLNNLLGCAPTAPKGKRPSAEEIFVLKAHAQRVKVFIQTLDKSQQVWLAQYKKKKMQARKVTRNKSGNGEANNPPKESPFSSAKAAAALLPLSFKRHISAEARIILARNISGATAEDLRVLRGAQSGILKLKRQSSEGDTRPSYPPANAPLQQRVGFNCEFDSHRGCDDDLKGLPMRIGNLLQRSVSAPR